MLNACHGPASAELTGSALGSVPGAGSMEPEMDPRLGEVSVELPDVPGCLC